MCTRQCNAFLKGGAHHVIRAITYCERTLRARRPPAWTACLLLAFWLRGNMMMILVLHVIVDDLELFDGSTTSRDDGCVRNWNRRVNEVVPSYACEARPQFYQLPTQGFLWSPESGLVVHCGSLVLARWLRLLLLDVFSCLLQKLSTNRLKRLKHEVAVGCNFRIFYVKGLFKRINTYKKFDPKNETNRSDLPNRILLVIP